MARSSSLGTIRVGKHKYWCSKINGKRYHFGNVAKVSKATAEAAFAKKLLAVRNGSARKKSVSKFTTVREVADRYLTWVEANRSKSNFRHKRSNFRRFCGWKVPRGLHGAGRPAGELHAMKVEKSHVDAYVAWMRTDARGGKGYANKTVYHAVTDIKACWNWARGERIFPRDFAPFKRVRRPRPPAKNLTEAALVGSDRVKAVIGEADKTSSTYGNLLRVYNETGARTGELLKARISDYSRRAAAITLAEHKTVKRTRRLRRIPLSDYAVELIEAEIERRKSEGRGAPDGFIFANGGAKGIHISSLNAWLPKWAARAGVEPWTSYDLRHRWISESLMLGTPIHKVAHMAGTSVREIERTYGHFFDDDVRSAANALSKFRRNGA